MFTMSYIVNLSIFSLMVCIPAVIQSFFNFRPIKYARYLGGLYGGLVSIVLVEMSFGQQGYIYDIRFAPIILSFTYFGPIGGMITAGLALAARLSSSGHWAPAIIGLLILVCSFLLLHTRSSRFSTVKKAVYFSITYVVIYFINVIIFNVLPGEPLFHLQYLFFVLVGVTLGVLLIESYSKLYRLNNRLTEMYKMIEEGESKYKLIAENTSDLIKVMNRDHSICYFSPSHEQVLGYHMEELEKIELCQFIHPEDVALFRSKIVDIFQKRESDSMEFRLLHKDGSWIEFESRCMPVSGENQEIEHIVIISRDISERKKSEAILLQSEKLSIVGELAAGVAHEIRNPLTTIKGFVQLVKAQNSSFEYSELLLNELERIETITSEMLALGKPQAVKLVRTDLRDLLENTLELLSPQALMNGIQFNLQWEDELFYMIGEKNQLKQVVLNVLKNAIEAMPLGGEISIDLKKDGEAIGLITIKDQGCGIPAELLPRLGEPFYSLKEKGTGLGLMICHKIIKQHNGTIRYSSMENEGTVVEIRLPLIIENIG
ncbi:ATP-binding protein [Bacillus sp. JJ1764]|uniref:ATP-binding protein n=1 Tax=Bacillus sp. JJ1764 TaxID=3122964 RepID=UPI002FFE8479